MARHPVARRVVSLTDRLTRVATLRGHGRRAVRNAALRLAGRIPSFRLGLATELAELRYR
jgi:2-polyprenyl-6-methoxyphenol hydroxylase-like FAD-dependent oxidoreductase